MRPEFLMNFGLLVILVSIFDNEFYFDDDILDLS